MTAVFADTFYWVALTDPDDELYQPALHIDRHFEQEGFRAWFRDFRPSPP